MHRPPSHPAPSRRHHETHARPIAPLFIGVVVAVGAMLVGLDALRSGDEPAGAAAVPAPTVPTVVETTAPVAGPRDVVTDGCLLDVLDTSVGDSGPSVECAQRALAVTGHYQGPLDGAFSVELETATVGFQVEHSLYADGIVGRRTATELGIWPGDDSFIVRTPTPEPGTYDPTGYELSPVASTGDDAPPLPDGADQRTGKRVVYERSSQRVWAIDADERVVRSYLVSGSRFANELPDVYSVYSKSELATGWNLEADLPYMVRYQRTDRGNIGFHQIPIHKADGTTYQTVDELGERLSGGCQRQHPLDAVFMWQFADVGTTVIVL